MISWRNPGPEHRDWDLRHLPRRRPRGHGRRLEITGQSDDLNLLGVCAGGITSAALLGHLAATGDDRGPLGHLPRHHPRLGRALDHGRCLISGPTLESSCAARASARGCSRARTCQRVFAWLRPNDLVWNYWVNNYLMGKNPPAFDVLAWNVDSTNLPAGLHQRLPRHRRRTNGLTEPGTIEVLDTPVDLGAGRPARASWSGR